MPLFRTVDRLRDLRETVLDAAPTADATQALLRLGQPLIGGNALGTVLGGRQLNGYLGDYINWQGTDAVGLAKNRMSLSPTGLLTLGDTDSTNSQILLRGSNSGNNVVQFGISGGGFPFLTIFEAGGGTTKTISRTDHNTKSWASLTLPISGAAGWLMQGRGGGILLGTDSALNDRFFFDDGGRAVIGSGTIRAAAVLDLISTTGSLGLPSMTTTQRNALAPRDGDLVYDSSLGKMFLREAGAWVQK